MKKALYRKYRPSSFSDVVGQEAVREALKNQIASGRFGHSYMFTGIRGTGKTTLARILAKAVNCPNVKDGEPCGVCDICKSIDEGSMLDVTEIDAASNNGVDNIRELREETAFAPSVCKFRVYIIDEAHMLSKDAWAALLKIMEEPPAHVIFILATTELHKVPATILSRCQRFDLRRIPKRGMIDRLLEIAQKEGITLTDDGAECIARLSDGAMRDALSLLDTSASLGGEVDAQSVSRLAGVADKSYLSALVADIARGDIKGLFGDLRSLYESSIDPARLCGELLGRYRDLLALSLAGEATVENGSPDELGELTAELKLYDARRLLAILDELTAVADKLSFAPDRTLALELALVKLSAAAGGFDAKAPAFSSDEKLAASPALSGERRAPSTAASAAPTPPNGARETVGGAAQSAQAAGISHGDSRAQATDAPARHRVGEALPPQEAHDAPESPDGAHEDNFIPPDDAPPWDEPGQDEATAPPESDEAQESEQAEPEADGAQLGGEDDDLFENVRRAASSSPERGDGDKAQKAERDAANVPEGLELFERWDDVLAAIRSLSPMIYGFLVRSRAYIDGARLLIDSDKLFLLKNDRSKLADIELAVKETTGLEVRVSAYEAPKNETKSGAAAELDDIFERAELNSITIDEIASQS